MTQPSDMPRRRAVFLDRDGVINKNRPDNVKNLTEFEFEHGVLPALARLATTGLPIVVVSNQSGIGRGQMTPETVEAIHRHMVLAISAGGGRIDQVYYCPHTAEQACPCRKPSPRMLEQARDELGLELGGSWFIGDWVDDVRAARNAGAIPLLVLSGRGILALERMRELDVPLPLTFQTLGDAVDHILIVGEFATPTRIRPAV